jgi:diguanylate cyclase (GGDEF)-like protein/PAS domain S-box-containing protein
MLNLMAILDSLPATLNCKDADGKYIMMNGYQARQLGIRPNDAIGKTTAELFGDRWGEIVQEQDSNVLQGGAILGPYREDYHALGAKSGYWLTYKFPVRLMEHGDFSHVVTLSFDITSMYEAEQQLTSAAFNDVLTGLHNRRWFDSRVKELDDELTLRKDFSVGVIVVDLDHFKRVNDNWGHLAGDEALKEVARRLQITVRSGDAIVRLGGEEFVVLVVDTNVTKLEATAERIRLAIAEKPFDIVETLPTITVSIGCAIAVAPRTLGQSLTVADRALYAAKGRGRNCVVVGEP